MQKILFIDTTNREKIIVKLIIDGEIFVKEEVTPTRKNQAVLPMIVSLLQEHSISLKDVTNIEVNPGPGSFTGIRVGVSVANALAYVLQIPINGKMPKDETGLVEPMYE